VTDAGKFGVFHRGAKRCKKQKWAGSFHEVDIFSVSEFLKSMNKI